jgi:hypothetical protein
VSSPPSALPGPRLHPCKSRGQINKKIVKNWVKRRMTVQAYANLGSAFPSCPLGLEKQIDRLYQCDCSQSPVPSLGGFFDGPSSIEGPQRGASSARSQLTLQSIFRKVTYRNDLLLK